MWLDIEYDLLTKWKTILIVTLVFELVYQSIVYFHPENLEWIHSNDFSWRNTLQYVFIDQFLIECLTITVLFYLIRAYGQKWGPKRVKLRFRSVLSYHLRFLPVILGAFFIFAPLTMTVRFLYHELPTPNWLVYFDEYFYSIKNYFNYLPALILIGYSGININLLFLYNRQLSVAKGDLAKKQRDVYKKILLVTDELGELLLDVEKIKWIERVDRKTVVTSLTGECHRLRDTIAKLEAKLNPNNFLRISRGVIVNLDQVLNYSFWENDKYVLRLKECDKEFVMSRDRLKKIKKRLLN